MTKYHKQKDKTISWRKLKLWQTNKVRTNKLNYFYLNYVYTAIFSCLLLCFVFIKLSYSDLSGTINSFVFFSPFFSSVSGLSRLLKWLKYFMNEFTYFGYLLLIQPFTSKYSFKPLLFIYPINKCLNVIVISHLKYILDMWMVCG